MSRHALLALVLLALPACNHEDDESIREHVGVIRFADCRQLEAHLEREALREMNATIDANLRGATEPTGVAAPLLLPTAPLPQPTPAPPSATDYTTTNTREKDVDEADFVKNDGSRIFLLHGRRLVQLAAWPPESTRLLWALPIEGSPREMYLLRDRVVVFSDVSLETVYQEAGIPWSPPPAPYGPYSSVVCLACPGATDGFKVTVIDVAGAPQVVREHYLVGQYRGSRRVGSRVRIVSTDALRGLRLSYWPDERVDWSNRGAVRAAFERLRERNSRLIRASSLKDWLPPRFEKLPGSPARALDPECTDFHASDAPARLGLSTVSTLDLDRLEAGLTHAALLHPADEVYASKDAVYLTARHSWLRPWLARVAEQHTYLHAFSIAGDAPQARYVASGGVPGHLLDSFSIDEEKGFLRVATTRFGNGGVADTDNAVYVLAQRGGRLERVGAATGLAPGERIYSARLDGRFGYLVTFEKVDPLFVIDLSVPTAPRVVGELKVPGFSTYIHALDERHLLTIGREALDTGRGSALFQGLSLQIFDVQDPASPRLLHRHVFGSRSSSSEALWDYKAFNYFPARGLLAVPFSDWAPGKQQCLSSLDLFHVDLAQGITPLGSVDHSDLVSATDGRGWGWTPLVRRSVMLDDWVYSVSYGGVKVGPAAAVERTLVTVPLPAEP